MSYLNRVGIRGIRSFDPNKEAVIKFQRPLTVIVGENGCGKTTIIECLKYATTSVLPVQGAMFVHDPQISGEAEISASVKLMFTTGLGQTYTSNQVMKVKRTANRKGGSGKSTFSTIDTVLTHHSNGKDRHLNNKCSSLADAVPMLLGVSKPILENVLFCHQEDSNWPMGSSNELQAKFNAIFQMTRYTKALDNIKDEIKFRKESQNKEENTIAGLKVEVAQIKEWRDKKQAHQAQLDEIEAEREKLTRELAQKRDDLRLAQETAKKAAVLDQRIRELEQKRDDELQARALAVQDRETTIQPGGYPSKTLEELEALSERNKGEMKKDDDIKKLQAQLAQLQADRQACDKELQELAGQKGKNEEQLRQRERVSHDLAAFVEDMVNQHNVDGTDAGDAANVVAALARKLEALRKMQLANKERRAQDQEGFEQELVQLQSLRATEQASFEAARKEQSQIKAAFETLNQRHRADWVRTWGGAASGGGCFALGCLLAVCVALCWLPHANDEDDGGR